MAAMAEAWIPTIIHPDRLADAELVGALSAMAQRNSPEEFARQIQALLGRPDMRHLLPAIRCPTLICCGRQDAWAGVAQHEEMAALIRDCRLAVIEHCGHLVTMERPDAVNRLLSGWLTA